MVERKPAMAKFARPNTKGALLRDTLFQVLYDLRSTPNIWIQGPAGAGKTTLVSSYLEAFDIPCLWYQIDDGDRDPASFFITCGTRCNQFRTKIKKIAIATAHDRASHRSVAVHATVFRTAV
ncbi:MAG: hypothetical protein WAK95_03395 [Desulfobacterales bacterium]